MAIISKSFNVLIYIISIFGKIKEQYFSLSTWREILSTLIERKKKECSMHQTFFCAVLKYKIPPMYLQLKPHGIWANSLTKGISWCVQFHRTTFQLTKTDRDIFRFYMAEDPLSLVFKYRDTRTAAHISEWVTLDNIIGLWWMVA